MASPSSLVPSRKVSSAQKPQDQRVLSTTSPGITSAPQFPKYQLKMVPFLYPWAGQETIMTCEREVTWATERLGIKRDLKCVLTFNQEHSVALQDVTKGDERIHKQRELLSLEYKLIIIMKTSD